MPELTLRSVILGLFLSVVMAAANVYLGLRVGMTVSASIPAAVVAMLLFRGLVKHRGLLEANQAQTAASAGESLAAGVIFTIPALVMIGAWQHFDLLLTTAVAFSGGVLGVLLMIPMRHVFITANDHELKFPEAVACAAVLRTGAANGDAAGGSGLILRGALFGMLIKLLVSFFGVARNTLEGATVLGHSVFYVGGDISVALFSVGVIVRLRIAVLLFLGGAFSWLIALPMMSIDDLAATSPVDLAYAIWSRDIRYIGVGAMVVGGGVAIFRVRRGLVGALQQLFVRRSPQVENRSDKGRDLSTPWVGALTFIAVILIAMVYRRVTGHWNVVPMATILMLLMAFFFAAVACYVVGLVGNSNSPVSGMTITALLVTGFWLFLLGFTGPLGMTATLGVAAVVCCTACTAGDICNDLKTGQLVGATPWRQQVMQVAGVAVAAVVLAPVLQLLHDTTPGGIGGKELAAPQAQLFASLVQGFFGTGQLPWQMAGIGAAIGIGVVLLDVFLVSYRSPFRAHLMPIAVGMYLPLGLSVPILAGALLAEILDHKSQPSVAGPGVLLASGAIAGEALTGILIALLVSLRVARLDPGLPDLWVTGITIAVVAVTFMFFVLASGRQRVTSEA